MHEYRLSEDYLEEARTVVRGLVIAFVLSWVFGGGNFLLGLALLAYPWHRWPGRLLASTRISLGDHTISRSRAYKPDREVGWSTLTEVLEVENWGLRVKGESTWEDLSVPAAIDDYDDCRQRLDQRCPIERCGQLAFRAGPWWHLIRLLGYWQFLFLSFSLSHKPLRPNIYLFLPTVATMVVLALDALRSWQLHRLKKRARLWAAATWAAFLVLSIKFYFAFWAGGPEPIG